MIQEEKKLLEEESEPKVKTSKSPVAIFLITMFMWVLCEVDNIYIFTGSCKEEIHMVLTTEPS